MGENVIKPYFCAEIKVAFLLNGKIIHYIGGLANIYNKSQLTRD